MTDNLMRLESEERPQLLLASRSPRRRELLTQMGVHFETIDVLVEEVPHLNESPESYVKRVAEDKAVAGWNLDGRRRELPVLGSDTAVIVNGEILGKPKDKADFMRMQTLLSANTHQVLTAVTVVDANQCETVLVSTDVTFAETSEAQRLAYWETSEPNDKAGGYAIQGYAAMFVSKLNGSYSGVVGLPVYETAELLRDFDIATLG